MAQAGPLQNDDNETSEKVDSLAKRGTAPHDGPDASHRRTKKSGSFALTGRRQLSASLAHRDIRPIPFRVQWQLETREILGEEMSFAAR